MEETLIEIKVIGKILKLYNETEWDILRHQENIQDADVKEWRNFSIKELKDERRLKETVLGTQKLLEEEKLHSTKVDSQSQGKFKDMNFFNTILE